MRPHHHAVAANRFYIVTGSGFGVHDSIGSASICPEDGSARLTDITSSRAVINLCGPKAREVLARVAEQDVSNAAFRYATARKITLGAAPVLAMRIGYVGELGWELHVPTEYSRPCVRAVCEAGRVPGIVDVGYRTIDTLRDGEGLPVLDNRHHAGQHLG